MQKEKSENQTLEHPTFRSWGNEDTPAKDAEKVSNETGGEPGMRGLDSNCFQEQKVIHPQKLRAKPDP